MTSGRKTKRISSGKSRKWIPGEYPGWVSSHRDAYGRPITCKSAKCPRDDCQRNMAFKEATILDRSFALRPPRWKVVLRWVEGPTVTEIVAGECLNRFTQRVRDSRKHGGPELGYYLRLEFSGGRPHVHGAITGPATVPHRWFKRLVKHWWKASCPDHLADSYCRPVRTPTGLAKYLAKDVTDRSRVELPPENWDGRLCHYIRFSANFFAAPRARLWEQYKEGRYGPNPPADPAPPEARPLPTPVCPPPREPRPTDLTDAQWRHVEPLIPASRSGTGKGGRPAASPRDLLDAVLYRRAHDTPWEGLPHDFPHHKTVYHHFNLWRGSGLWEQILERLREDEGRRAEAGHPATAEPTPAA